MLEKVWVKVLVISLAEGNIGTLPYDLRMSKNICGTNCLNNYYDRDGSTEHTNEDPIQRNYNQLTAFLQVSKLGSINDSIRFYARVTAVQLLVIYEHGVVKY